MRDSKRIVLGFSGGLDSTIAAAWLRERHSAEIIAVTVDVGQGGDLEEVRDRALAAGAARAHVLDAREEFAREFIVPSLQADALYDDRYPLVDALGDSLVARKLVEIADIEQAAAVAHCARAIAAAPAGIDVALRALRPDLTVIAAAAEWGLNAAQLAAYGSERGIPLPPRTRPGDGNIWGRAVQCGIVDDSWREAPEDLYTLTKSGAECPNEPASVELGFDRGVPVAINGVAMPLVDLIASLATISGAHGVGRLDLLESSAGGEKTRTVYEAPAALVLHVAHRELQKLIAGRDVDRFSRLVRNQYADLIRGGHWFSPLRAALDAYAQALQPQVTGVVRLRLFKGACRTVGRKPSQPPAAGRIHKAPACTTADS